MQQKLKKTVLTIQAHELIAGCPHAFFCWVLPISAPQILKKTVLTIQAHELVAKFPHNISAKSYKLMRLVGDTLITNTLSVHAYIHFNTKQITIKVFMTYFLPIH